MIDNNAIARLQKDYAKGQINKDELISRLGRIRDSIGDPVPEVDLTEAQRGLWLLQTVNPQSSAYNLPVTFKSAQQINIERFNESVRALIAAHPILSARVAEHAGRLKLVPGDWIPVVEEVDAATWSEDRQNMEIQQFASQAFHNIAEGLVRIRVFNSHSAATVVMVIHHIVFDGRSVVTLFADLWGHYFGQRSNMHRDLEYFAFAAHEQQLLAAERGQERIRYWRKRLSGVEQNLRLCPGAEPGSAPTRQNMHRVDLPEALLVRADGYARRHSVFLSTLLLGVYQYLLSRYARTDDVTVGLPVDGRDLQSGGRAVGMFTNMVPVRSDLSLHQSFAQFLKQLQRDLILDVANVLPFPALARSLAGSVDSSNLLQIAFEYQGQVELSDTVEITGISIDRNITQEGEFEFALEVYRVGDALSLNFKYDPARYSAAWVQKFADQFVGFLHSATQSDISLTGSFLSADELEAVNAVSQGMCVDFGTRNSVLQDIAAVVADTPSVIWSENEQIDYRELWRRVCLVADSLIADCGISKGDLVGLYMDRSIEMVISLLAILKAGGVYVPLEPDYPIDRLAFMIADSGLEYCVSRVQQPFPTESISGNSLSNLVYEDLLDKPSTRSPLHPQIAASDLAYVIYTSGSTGKPKGVMIDHGALYNRIAWMQLEYKLTREDRVLQKTPFSFDVSGWEFYWPLMVGADLYLLPARQERNLQYLHDFIVQQRISVLHFVPSILNQILRLARSNLEADLRMVFCSGEALPPALIRSFAEKLPDIALHNLYGPTEAAIDVTYWPCDPAANVSYIGRPIANVNIYIVGHHNQLLPLGQPGEICISGRAVAQGYINNLALTGERFVQQPDTNQLIYKTGDLGCWNTSGELTFIGRIDNQIKLRGFRIEPDEIAAQIAEISSIDHCLVDIVEIDGHARLTAWYTLAEPGTSVAETELRQFLQNRLPEFMIPARYLVLSEFPKLHNGKIDRTQLRSLPAQDAQKPATIDTLAAVSDIWRSVLARSDIDTRAGFFELGGDSILALQVVEQLNARYDCELSVTHLFRYPTAEQLSGFILSRIGSAQEAQRVEENCSGHSDQIRPGDEQDSLSSAGTTVRQSPLQETRLAIVGMACRVPGAATHHEFWRNLVNGDEAIRIQPLDPAEESGNSHFVGATSTIDSGDRFDAAFFSMAPREAQLLSKQQRLLLQLSWGALEDAGYRSSQITNVGVFVSESARLAGAEGLALEDPIDQYLSWILTQPGSTPTLISYRLGLHGPSYAVHSNCSSSLTGLYNAKLNIDNGSCDTALVGGCTLLGASRGYHYHPNMNFSRDGHVRPFDAEASGMVGGEGAVVMVVTTVRKALERRNTIYAVLRGIAVNNDGQRKPGFYAPSADGQQQVIAAAYADSAIDACSIQYIEAHGTGTRIGDPVEFEALCSAHNAPANAGYRCGLGSVKSNIGHLDTAAGLTGCVKVALSLYHGEIPASINYAAPNPLLDLETSPFYVVDRLLPWSESDGRDKHSGLANNCRRAAISSFGIGGTNVHAVLDSFHTPAAAAESRGHQLILLSARTSVDLQEYCRRMADFLAVSQPRLVDVAYTLQVGREPMDCRLALVVPDIATLVEGLRRYAEGEETHAHAYASVTSDTSDISHDEALREVLASWLQHEAYDKLAAWWVRGVDVQWHEIQNAQRISLSTYPFSGESYATPDAAEQVTASLSEASEGDCAESGIVNCGSLCAHIYRAEYHAIVEEATSSSLRSGTTMLVAVGDKNASASALEAILCDRDATLVCCNIVDQETVKLAENRWLLDVADPQAFVQCMSDVADMSRLIFVGGCDPVASTNEDIRKSLQRNEVQMLRAVQSLRALLSDADRIELFTLNHRSIDFSFLSEGAGLSGLTYAIAQRDHRFGVRNLTVDPLALEQADKFADSLGSISANNRGDLRYVTPYGMFANEFLRQDFQSLDVSRLKQGGVYLIAGGGGEVGEVLSRYLFERYKAKVVWLGRSADYRGAVQTTLAEHLHLLSYRQADVTSVEEVEAAVAWTEKKYGRLDGAFFLAVSVNPQAESVENASEEVFQSSVEVKALGYATFYHVFRHRQIDFLCFFSSAQAFSFSGASKLAAYATGVTSADSFALARFDNLNFPVALINWGAWSSTLGASFSIHMQSLTDEEALASLEAMLSTLGSDGVERFVCIKVSEQVARYMNLNDLEQVTRLEVG